MNERLPEGWAWAPLPSLGELNRGRSRHRPRDAEHLYGGDYPFVQTGDIARSRGRITSHRQTYSDAGLAQSRLWPKNTVCITIAANIADSAILTYEACFPDSVVGFVALPTACLPEYVEFFIRTAREDLSLFAPATAQKNINLETLRKLRVPLPPLAEQMRIVATVEALLARVNAARQQLAKVPAILKRFRQSVLAAACSGRLTADWREEQTELQPAQGSFEGPEDLPETWTWATFGDLIGELRNGISTKPNPDPPGHPILRISSTRPGRVLLDDIRYLPHADDLIEVYALRDRDLLFTRYNGSLELLGVCGMVRGLGKRTLLYPDKLMRVRIRNEKLQPEYVEAYFGSPQARDRIEAKSKSSAGQQGVSGADIKRQPIAVPPLAEQHEIVRRVEALFRLADAIEKRLAAATARSEKLTQAILAKAFRGELVPREAELARREGRDYEPASALAERIPGRRGLN